MCGEQTVGGRAGLRRGQRWGSGGAVWHGAGDHVQEGEDEGWAGARQGLYLVLTAC